MHHFICKNLTIVFHQKWWVQGGEASRLDILNATKNFELIIKTLEVKSKGFIGY